jgi:hypothetical protein
VLVRVTGPGAESLLGVEEGLHRFVGLAGDPCHVWVELVEARAEFADNEWPRLPTPPSPRAPRGRALREVTIGVDRVAVKGVEIEPPWSELPRRLAEAAVTRLITAHQHAGHKCSDDELEKLWMYPLAMAKATEGAS